MASDARGPQGQSEAHPLSHAPYGTDVDRPKPNTSRPNKAQKTYPYLLGALNITEANHVWRADITDIPMRK